MQYLPAFCLALVAVIATSCSTDPEDRRFFNTGWMRPEAGSDARLESPQTLIPIKNEYDQSPKQAPQTPAQADR